MRKPDQPMSADDSALRAPNVGRRDQRELREYRS
jgi:hypothetical protein